MRLTGMQVLKFSDMNFMTLLSHENAIDSDISFGKPKASSFSSSISKTSSSVIFLLDALAAPTDFAILACQFMLLSTVWKFIEPTCSSNI
jgi:hypothetical protein